LLGDLQTRVRVRRRGTVTGRKGSKERGMSPYVWGEPNCLHLQLGGNLAWQGDL